MTQCRPIIAASLNLRSYCKRIFVLLTQQGQPSTDRPTQPKLDRWHVLTVDRTHGVRSSRRTIAALTALACLLILNGCGSASNSASDADEDVQPRPQSNSAILADSPQPDAIQAADSAPTALAPAGPALPDNPAQNVVVDQAAVGDDEGTRAYPTMADYWAGMATFHVDVPITGLPMGESETIQMVNGELWSYVHASDRSAKVIDQCGAPVEFPGCTVIYRSFDGGVTFELPDPVCQIECQSCPCTPEDDHINQQQYPRVIDDGTKLRLVYEFGAMVFHRESVDGLQFGGWDQIPWTGVWDEWLRECPAGAETNTHPFVPEFYDCLMGGPPGIATDGTDLYVFVGMGQNPGAMGCYRGSLNREIGEMVPCANNPLFVGDSSYGPLEEKGPETNPYFMFRTVSSADVQKVDEYYYMLFEGVRGPGPGDPGDTQFALGLARSQPNQMDGPWDLFPDNPILVDMPGNIGLGHADIITIDGQTFIYTSLDGETRSRLVLAWNE